MSTAAAATTDALPSLGKSSTAAEVADRFVPDPRGLSGRTAFITGASAGIGAETARVLASKGCRVVMACRDVEKGGAKLDAMGLSDDERENVKLVALDLASFDSIEACAAEAIKNEERIDYLVLNAGIMATPQSTTKEGFELQLGTNHIGHHYLTNLLMPMMKNQPSQPGTGGQKGRVVVLSSTAHSMGTLDFDDLNFERGERKYSPWGAYGQSKLANMLHAKALAKRLAGTGWSAYAVHPGVIVTDLWNFALPGPKFLRGVVGGLASAVVGDKSVEQGTATSVYACLAPNLEVVSGSYLADCDVAMPKTAEGRDADESVRERLWVETEKAIEAALAKRNP
eukprot:CAMPEP_0119513530 /NCGR_PEP_ID=MMETSP1344-20130328/31615_1 /TAXON_ID=236787 /ORGANISM="Florenciella parvula, Strain CCMP2471" /LENGTH=340 /DNA_ID=CAMNT_0007550761 /DNA_START=14 /DNA_END=1036 /DNA_ORIENTATION=-